MKEINGKKFVSFREENERHMKDPEYRKLCEALQPKFDLIRAYIDCRQTKGMTQKELAKKMGTYQSAIARFESGGYNPSLFFASRLAIALGMRLRVVK